MARRRKKKAVPVIHQSIGPLPLRLAERFADQLLVFSDASQRRHGGLAAVLFADHEAEPLIATRTVAAMGSNELELQAALFAVEEAARHYPGRRIALFSDNRDAVDRLARAAAQGMAEDGELRGMLAGRGIADALSGASVTWVRAHAGCRGNTLADRHAAEAADRPA